MFDFITLGITSTQQVANHYIDAQVQMNLVNAHWGAVTAWGIVVALVIAIGGIILAIVAASN